MNNTNNTEATDKKKTQMPHKVLISSNPASIRAVSPDVTVEAEYGDEVVEGRALTMAHHGPRAGQKCPCQYDNDCALEAWVNNFDLAIGISHFDLDTLGGVLAALGQKPDAPAFWDAAEFVDLNGPHRVSDSAHAEQLPLLQAWWASSPRVFAPRDGSVADVTADIEVARKVLEAVLARDADVMEAGAVLAAAEARTRKESFVEEDGGVCVRVSPAFVNAMYTSASSCVVAYNTVTGAVTVSFADAAAVGSASAREIVQMVFKDRGEDGELLAGGHATIAGSPRSRRATLEEFAVAVAVARKTLE